MTSPQGTIVDLFAGAGGWEEGLAQLGHQAIGLEIDPVACKTAVAAGHHREQLDVAATDPHRFGPVWGLIGSPPCQAYSVAGKGLGRADQPRVVACAKALAEGRDTRAWHLARCQDQRSLLTVEPLRWALALRPEWIALEQVPPVLGLWELFAEALGAAGYHCDVGILSAERYGVAQTRRRVYLVANRRRPVALPAPTHRSYNPRDPDRVTDEERCLRPWVSMAEALGIEGNAVSHSHCYPTQQRPHGMVRSAAVPSRTVDTRAREWTVTHPRPCEGRRHAAAALPDAAARLTSRPGTSTPSWVQRRPATTIAADPRVQPPGHKRNASDPPGRYPGRAGRDAVRVTVDQAAALQGFRPDYPWQGSRRSRFAQVGNAVCPPMARHVLAAAIGQGGRSHG